MFDFLNSMCSDEYLDYAYWRLLHTEHIFKTNKILYNIMNWNNIMGGYYESNFHY